MVVPYPAKGPAFPLRIFYDGACPVCSREIEHYRSQDRQGRIVPVDISAPDFDPLPYGIPMHAFQFELHAIDHRGAVYRGVAAFRAIWQAFPDRIAYRLMAAAIGLPVINSAARLGYRWFARLRPRLPGRKDACAGETCRIGRKGRGDE